MRKLILLIFLVGAIRTVALDNHFIYIQSESGKPFYLSLNSKVFSSSPTGWLILPALAEGEYQFSIGSPHKEFPDYKFKCKVSQRDMGFILKKLSDKGLGLQNIQNSDVMKGDPVESASSLRNSSGNLSDDPFSTMLASVVDDQSIREHPYVPVEEKVVVNNPVPKTDSVKTAPPAPLVNAAAAPVAVNNAPAVAGSKTTAKKGSKVALFGTKKATTKKTTPPASDSLTAKDSLSSKPSEAAAKQSAQKTDSVAVAPANAKPTAATPTVAKSAAALTPGIFRSSQSGSSEGTDLVYVDRNADGTADTVRIFISKKIEEPPKTTVVAAAAVTEQKKPASNNDPRFLDMSVYPKSAPAETGSVSKPATTNVVQPAPKVDSVNKELPEAATINPNCKGIANDDDVFKLRKRMLTKTDEDQMVMMALKEFKLHCYSADKIRSLSYIFLTQKGKYQLLDAAWPYVYDQSNFKKLGDVLTDSYYVNRFNALIQ